MDHSVQPPPPLFCRGEGVEPPIKFSKRWALASPQLLEGVAGKEGGDFFRGGGGGGGGGQFSHKK